MKMSEFNGLAVSWVGSLATIMWLDTALAVVSGIFTIALTASMLIKNIQTIKKNRKDVRKDSK